MINNDFIKLDQAAFEVYGSKEATNVILDLARSGKIKIFFNLEKDLFNLSKAEHDEIEINRRSSYSFPKWCKYHVYLTTIKKSDLPFLETHSFGKMELPLYFDLTEYEHIKIWMKFKKGPPTEILKNCYLIEKQKSVWQVNYIDSLNNRSEVAVSPDLMKNLDSRCEEIKALIDEHIDYEFKNLYPLCKTKKLAEKCLSAIKHLLAKRLLSCKSQIEAVDLSHTLKDFLTPAFKNEHLSMLDTISKDYTQKIYRLQLMFFRNYVNIVTFQSVIFSSQKKHPEEVEEIIKLITNQHKTPANLKQLIKEREIICYTPLQGYPIMHRQYEPLSLPTLQTLYDHGSSDKIILENGGTARLNERHIESIPKLNKQYNEAIRNQGAEQFLYPKINIDNLYINRNDIIKIKNDDPTIDESLDKLNDTTTEHDDTIAQNNLNEKSNPEDPPNKHSSKSLTDMIDELYLEYLKKIDEREMHKRTLQQKTRKNAFEIILQEVRPQLITEKNMGSIIDLIQFAQELTKSRPSKELLNPLSDRTAKDDVKDISWYIRQRRNIPLWNKIRSKYKLKIIPEE